MGKGYSFARGERTQVEYHDVTDGVHENHYNHEVDTNFLSVGLFSHLLYLGVLGADGHFRAFQHSPTTLQLCWFEELSAHQ